MHKIPARQMLTLQAEDLWDYLTGDHIVVFDDGAELVADAWMTCFSSYAWDYHRRFPETPLLKEHHIQSVLGNRRFYSGADRDLLGRCLEATYEQYKGRPESNRDELGRILYRIVTRYYALTRRFEKDVPSLNIKDFIGILDHPDVAASKAEQEPYAWSIKKAYRDLDSLLKDREKMGNNRVAQLYQSGLVNAGQVHQSIGPRGYVTDTDSVQFQFPIMRGYVEGLRSAYDSFIESRSASKSLQFSKDNLRAAEYFSRKLQLADMAVKHLHVGDCGSQSYLHWRMEGQRLDDDGEKITDDDPTLLAGKFYLDEQTNTLKAIKASDKHLIGKTLKLRSAMECAHPDPDGICEVCFGELSMQVPWRERTNIGHLCCVNMTEPSTQSVLSVKHKDASAEIDPIVIDDNDREYLRTSRDRQSYILMPGVSKLKAKLVIASITAPALNDVRSVNRVEDFNISRISEMGHIWLGIPQPDGVLMHPLKVHMGKRKSSLTYAMLNHIRNRGWEINNDGNYVVSLEGWNFNDPILTLPLQHFNMSEQTII